MRFITAICCALVMTTACATEEPYEETGPMVVSEDVVLIRNGVLWGDAGGYEFDAWAEYLDLKENDDGELMIDVIGYAGDRWIMARFWLDLTQMELAPSSIFSGLDGDARAFRCEGPDADMWTVDREALQTFVTVSQSPFSDEYDRLSFRIDTLSAQDKQQSLFGTVDVHKSL